jgi:hypothetical protein
MHAPVVLGTGVVRSFSIAFFIFSFDQQYQSVAHHLRNSLYSQKNISAALAPTFNFTSIVGQ